MMTIFLGLDFEIKTFEHFLPVKTFAQAAYLRLTPEWLLVCGVHYFSRTRVST